VRSRSLLALGGSRLQIGRDVRVVSADDRDICMEATIRLRPGQRVSLVGMRGAGGRAEVVVLTWRIARLSDAGPVYRGRCRLEG
jgi:hypothetical protein